MLKPVLRVLLCVCLSATVALPQAEVGAASLHGTVSDASGAAVPNAGVTLTNLQTGLPKPTTTNQAGLYNFPQLPVGSYDLTVEAKGFKASKRTGIALTVGAVASMDVSLEIGATQETVSVTAEVPVVETT